MPIRQMGALPPSLRDSPEVFLARGKAAENRPVVSCPQRRAQYLFFMEKTPETKVLFNNDCPVCSFEINHYAAYAKQKGLQIRFDDLNGANRAAWGIDEDTAARRLYVLHNGELTSGIPAFLVLWREMPRYRWLSRIVGLPGVRHVASFMYDHALAPLIYRWHLRRKARRISQSG